MPKLTKAQEAKIRGDAMGEFLRRGDGRNRGVGPGAMRALQRDAAKFGDLAVFAAREALPDTMMETRQMARARSRRDGGTVLPGLTTEQQVVVDEVRVDALSSGTGIMKTRPDGSIERIDPKTILLTPASGPVGNLTAAAAVMAAAAIGKG